MAEQVVPLICYDAQCPNKAVPPALAATAAWEEQACL